MEGPDAKRPASPLRFGIFDWIDDSRRPPAEVYEHRLKLIEYADRAGFWCYHVAEHHGTPLGLAPSPNLFLASAASRTRRIRLGTLVNVLPLYDPVRLVEEICMLDHLSRGRLELGVGRGGSPAELVNYGVEGVEEARALYMEVFEMLIAGLRHGRIEHNGKRFSREATLSLRPYQRPYPPLWFPTSNPESVPWIAQQGLSTLFGFLVSRVGADSAEMVKRYEQIWQSHRSDGGRLNHHVAEPLVGHQRHVYVAETDAEALRDARTALAGFFANFNHLWLKHQGKEYFSSDFDAFVEQRFLLAGSPESVREQLRQELPKLGGNYFVATFAFGTLTEERSLRSIDLFAREVMPAMSREVQTPS